MKKMWWLGALLALPLAVVGLNAAQPEPSGYICPLTGEELPCPDCCPAKGKQDVAGSASAPRRREPTPGCSRPARRRITW